jgi:hypothetical protein
MALKRPQRTIQKPGSFFRQVGFYIRFQKKYPRLSIINIQYHPEQWSSLIRILYIAAEAKVFNESSTIFKRFAMKQKQTARFAFIQ